MPFTTDLIMRADGSHYILEDVLSYQTRYKGRHYSIDAPVGFRTDLASVPRIFRPIYTGHDRTRKPAVIHDYTRRNKIYPNWLCDKLFLIAMKEEDVPGWKRRTMYWAVRFESLVRGGG